MAKVRDYAIVKTKEEITQENIQEVFHFFNIFPGGFTLQDRLLLKKLSESTHPISLDSLAALIHEESGTIEEFYEPFLIHQELILRTPRGRILNPQKKAYIQKIIDNL